VYLTKISNDVGQMHLSQKQRREGEGGDHIEGGEGSSELLSRKSLVRKNQRAVAVPNSEMEHQNVSRSKRWALMIDDKGEASVIQHHF